MAENQAHQLNDYASAETNYKQAIEIIKELPKDKNKYQSYLASIYKHLAYAYDKQNKYEEAITAINTAIEILCQLKERDSKYMSHWLNFRYHLAEIKYNNGKDLDEVKNTLLEIKLPVQQCLMGDPDNKWIKEANAAIADLLSKINN